MKILVLNSGSSSIKYQLIDMDTRKPVSSGLVERIGQAEGVITHKYLRGGKMEKHNRHSRYRTIRQDSAAWPNCSPTNR